MIDPASRMTMQQVAGLAKNYASARDALDLVLQDIVERRRKVVRPKMRGLRNRVADTAAAREALETAVRDNPHLFERPKTQAVEGVQFGYRKQTGKLEVSDEANTIKLIKSKLPEHAATLITTKESIDKSALRKLPARDLARVGAELTDPVDKVTITVPKTDLDALVDALLGDATDQTEEDGE